MHCEIVGQGILHCDISINNIMIYFEYTANGIIARGLLIDYNYTTKISKQTDYAIGQQDLTVSKSVSVCFAEIYLPLIFRGL
jgi:hypothetical protein